MNRPENTHTATVYRAFPAR